MEPDATILNLVTSLHRQTLTKLAANANSHFQGCAAGCRPNHLSGTIAKRVKELDVVKGWVHKITPQSCDRFLKWLDEELARAKATHSQQSSSFRRRPDMPRGHVADPFGSGQNKEPEAEVA